MRFLSKRSHANNMRASLARARRNPSKTSFSKRIQDRSYQTYENELLVKNAPKNSLAKDPTVCSCGCHTCEYRLRWSSLWGHEACEGCAEIGGADTCGHRRWGLRWSSSRGHETREGCAEMGWADARGHSHWGLRWSSLWGHEACEGCAEIGGAGACVHRH